MPERWGLHPRLERRLVPPPGHHQPGGPPVGRLEQLEALEAVLVVYRAGPRGEPAGEFVAAVGGYGNRVDPHDRHTSDHARTARQADTCRASPAPASSKTSSIAAGCGR